MDEEKKSISVYFGLELMEVVPDDFEHMAFKMMVGRLYNAKVKVATLENVFEVNRKTIRSWGHAILSRDANELERVLLGRRVSRKRTPAIDKYVRRRWADLVSEGCVDYRTVILREVAKLFEVKLSGETLRQIVQENQIGEADAAGRFAAQEKTLVCQAPRIKCPQRAVRNPHAPACLHRRVAACWAHSLSRSINSRPSKTFSPSQATAHRQRNQRISQLQKRHQTA